MARFALVTLTSRPSFTILPRRHADTAVHQPGPAPYGRPFPTPTARLVDIEESDGTKRKVVEVSNEVEAASVTLAPVCGTPGSLHTGDALRATQGDVNEEPLYASYGRLGTHVIKVAMVPATMDATALPITVELRHYARAQQIVETWR